VETGFLLLPDPDPPAASELGKRECFRHDGDNVICCRLSTSTLGRDAGCALIAWRLGSWGRSCLDFGSLEGLNCTLEV
jgi:hypothetical protein